MRRWCGDLSCAALEGQLGLEVGVVAMHERERPLALEHCDEALHELTVQLAAGHAPQLEQVQATATKVLEFLAPPI